MADWHDDKPDQWTPLIRAAHPMKTGAHEHYATALEMVGNRRSKGELVALVCWLLQRADDVRVRAGFAHEVWAAAQLTPGEGIKDGVARVLALLSAGVMVDAPALPPLPEPGDTDGCTYAAYTDDQMREYARAALAAYGVDLPDGGQGR